MAARKDYSEDLRRIERKLDRLTRIVVLLLLCQPLLLVGTLLPDLATQVVAVGLLGTLGLLILFPNIERKLPVAMRRLGRAFGRARRWTRAVMPG